MFGRALVKPQGEWRLGSEKTSHFRFLFWIKRSFWVALCGKANGSMEMPIEPRTTP